MCDPVTEMAVIEVTTVSKEELWIPDLQAQLAVLDEKIGQLEHERCVIRKALTVLHIRKEKAEANQ